MPVQFFWGKDEFLLQSAIKQLCSQILVPQWVSFNYFQYLPESKESILQAFADIMSPPVGVGSRLVYLPDSNLLGVCPKEILNQLERILPIIPESNVLLITSSNKPDSRNKSVKLLLKYADVREFPLIPQWQTDALMQQVHTVATELGVKLTTGAEEHLVESVGNNTRLLFTELEKLKVYANNTTLNADAVKDLVSNNATNSLQLAAAIRTGNVSLALELAENLIHCNEPALKIVATLITAFRTWLIVKLCIAAGEKDDGAIARMAEIKNPKRLYFLRQEVTNVPLSKLEKSLKILLELELMLKSGWEEITALSTQIIEICLN